MATPAVRSARRPDFGDVARLLVLACSCLTVVTARAFPGFGNDRSSGCADCHDVVPRLNATGTAFAQQGYRGDRGGAGERHGARAAALAVVGEISTGPTWSTTPAASSHDFRGDVDRLELGTAGALGRRVSFALRAGLPERGEGPECEAASAQLDDVFRGGVLNVRAGRFDAEAPFLSRARRTTLRDYLTPVSFEARGLELNGERGAWVYALGLCESGRRFSGPTNRTVEHVRLEDTYVRVTRGGGPNAIAAQVLFDKQDSDLATHAWLQHIRAEVAAQLGTDRLHWIPCYVLDRFDDRPGAGIHEHHHDLMLETVATLDRERRWALTARVEIEERVRNAIDPYDRRELEVLDLARAVTPNATLAVEWSRLEALRSGWRANELQAIVRASR